MTILKQRELFNGPTHDSNLPYSSAVRFGDLVWSSGQLGVNKDVSLTFSEQLLY